MSGAFGEMAGALGRSLELSILVKATAAIVLGLAAARMARRARASIRHLMLASAFGALLVLPLAVIVAPPVWIEVPVAFDRSVTPAVTGPSALPGAGARDGTPRRAGESGPRLGPSRLELIRAGWAAGAALALASLAAALLRIQRIRRRGLPWPDRRELISAITAEAGLRRPVEIVLHEAIAAPLTFGLLHPAIALPCEAALWSSADLRRALVHEVEHVRRCDWATQWLARGVCALYWFHPLVWLAMRRLGLEAERACDDAVVHQSEPTEYAEQLVLLARRLSSMSLEGGLAMTNRSDLSTRVSAVLDAAQPRGRAGALAKGAAAAAAASLVLALAPMRAVGAAPERVAAAGEKERRPTWRDHALFEAAERGDVQAIAELIDAGAGVDAALEGDGSPLIAAARAGQLEAVRLLLDRGADPNLAVSGDGNPLIGAAQEGHAGVVELLLERGARIDETVPGDENALIQASGNGHLPIVKLLVTRGADVNSRAWAESAYERADGEWRTPLSMARKSGHAAVVGFLLSAGAHE